MNRNENDTSTAESTAPPKRAYQKPTLLTFGMVASLTNSSVCSTAADNLTVPGCGPGNMAMSSERRVKEDIVRIGSHPLGMGLYLFRYRPEFRAALGHGRRFGVMAEEVEAIVPEAVSLHADGYKRVDYAMLGITDFVT